jgi:carboxypeptidase A1
VKFPFAIELRDTGKYGFLLPPEYIVPSGEEMWAGMVAMSYAILKALRKYKQSITLHCSNY